MRIARDLKTALIVEDDDALARALVHAVAARGIAGHVVSTLKDAELVQGEGWDLALVDVNLPDGSGVTLCRSLAAQRPCPVIVAISGAATGRDGFALARAGVGEFVEKPFDDDDLWRAIEKNSGVPLEVTVPSLVGAVPMRDAHRAVRRRMLEEALARSNTITDAAKLLGVTRQAIQQAIDDLEEAE